MNRLAELCPIRIRIMDETTDILLYCLLHLCRQTERIDICTEIQPGSSFRNIFIYVSSGNDYI